jgi:A/G-specific adenine glycosylase
MACYNPNMAPSMAKALLAWYRANARALPWRGSGDPYAIWISEIMLQQTRVETVLPYYARWMQRFPTADSVAAARLDEVLRLWEGLGYYRRAVNLHRAARVLVEQHGGTLPRTLEELRRLPGVGRYTAAAIASLAFGQDEVALDGNLRRALARYFDLELDPRTAEGERALLAKARRAQPAGKSAQFNQALMDLAATLCTPRSPACGACPLRSGCLAFRRGTQAARPVRSRRGPLPQRQSVAGVVLQDGAALLLRRESGALLGDLWGFPEGERRPGESGRAALRRILRQRLGVRVQVGPALPALRHSYTHFQVVREAYLCRLAGDLPRRPGQRWVRRRALSRYPMGRLDRSLARLWAEAEDGEG